MIYYALRDIFTRTKEHASTLRESEDDLSANECVIIVEYIRRWSSQRDRDLYLVRDLLLLHWRFLRTSDLRVMLLASKLVGCKRKKSLEGCQDLGNPICFGVY